MKNKHITLTEGVTIENALHYIDAIVQSTKGIKKLPIEKRAYVLDLISKYLQNASMSVRHDKENMIKRSEASKLNSAFHSMFDAVFDKK